MPASLDNCERVSPDCPVEDTIYGYAPNLGGCAFYAIIFAACSLSQLYFTFRYWRLWKGYSILVLVGCLGECCGYVGRILLNKNVWDGAAMRIQLLLLMFSPSFLAAALYMTLRTLVQYFGQEHTRLPARFWTWPFVTADLIGFLLQCGGGIVAAMGDDGKPGFSTAGNAIMISGVTFQAIVMIVAGILTTDFALRFRRRQGQMHAIRYLPQDLKIFFSSMLGAFLLILTRCIYRIPEMAGGIGGPLMRKEVDFMIFDGCMILISSILLTVVHPGIFASIIREGTTYINKSEGHQLDSENGFRLSTNERRSERTRWAASYD